MKHNVGKIDKIIRYVLALVFVYLGYVYSAWWYIPAIIAAGTALIGWCGLYRILGINTCKVKAK
jgi:hypothetical protein